MDTRSEIMNLSPTTSPTDILDTGGNFFCEFSEKSPDISNSSILLDTPLPHSAQRKTSNESGFSSGYLNLNDTRSETGLISYPQIHPIATKTVSTGDIHVLETQLQDPLGSLSPTSQDVNFSSFITGELNSRPHYRVSVENHDVDYRSSAEAPRASNPLFESDDACEENNKHECFQVHTSSPLSAGHKCQDKDSGFPVSDTEYPTSKDLNNQTRKSSTDSELKLTKFKNCSLDDSGCPVNDSESSLEVEESCLTRDAANTIHDLQCPVKASDGTLESEKHHLKRHLATDRAQDSGCPVTEELGSEDEDDDVKSDVDTFSTKRSIIV